MSLPFPDPHPLLVHLPVGLLSLAVALDLAAWLSGHTGLARAARWLYLGSALAAWMAVWSGDRAAQAIPQPTPELEAAVTRHGDLGHLAAWLATLVALGSWSWPPLAARLRARRRHPVRLLLLGLALGGFVALWLAAVHGAGLVFRYGVGVTVAR